MKKIVFLIGFILLLGIVFVFSQAPSKIIKNDSKGESQSLEKNKLVEYIPQVIIEGKWGMEPGQFGMTMFEGTPVFPKLLVVDSKENIFLLDTFNNRIQKFDKEGVYITSISVESYRRSTKKEVDESKNTWNKSGLDFPTIYAQELYIDQEDNLYLELEKKDIITGQAYKKFFKYTQMSQKKEVKQSEFENIKELRQPQQLFIKSKNIKYLIELMEDAQKHEQNIRIHNLKTNQVQNIPFKPKYPATKIGFVKVDTDNKIYVFTAWPPQIHKYDLQGNVLSIVDLYGLPNPYGKHPILNSVPYIDADGNIYQMELIPNPDKQIEYLPGEAVGLKIIKWEVRK